MLSTNFDLRLNNIGCKSKLKDVICRLIMGGGSWLSLLNDYTVFKGNDALQMLSLVSYTYWFPLHYTATLKSFRQDAKRKSFMLQMWSVIVQERLR